MTSAHHYQTTFAVQAVTMQVIILAVLTSLALCFSEQPHLGRRFAASMNLSASSIQAAVEAWQNDTMVVSQFLDTPSNASAYNGTDSSLMSSVSYRRHWRSAIMIG